MKRVRVAVIGTGHLGSIHARLLRSVERAELVAVSDVSVEACQKLAAELETQAVPDYRQLIGQIDAAVVATPTCTHWEVALELLRQGVHVLVEKPLAASVAEADELVTEARSRRLVLQVGHVERFNPALTAVRPHIQQPKYIEALRMGPYTFRSTDIGVVHDLMIHDIDVVLSLVDSPVLEVDALGVAVFGPHEDLASARLVFGNGCVAWLRACRTGLRGERSMQVFTPRGFASVDFASRQVRVVKPSAALVHRQIDVHRLSPAEKTLLKENMFQELMPVQELTPEPRNAILDEQEDFITGILTGRPVRVDGRQARDALAVAQRVLDQIASHPWEGAAEGPVGPAFAPAAGIVPAPHFQPNPSPSSGPLRRAG